MKMVSMKLPPLPNQDDMSGHGPHGECEPGSEEMYPYGLCISLENKQLDVLGIKDMPKVGDTMSITANVLIVGVNSNQSRDGSNERTVRLQITDMAIGGQKSNAAEKLYGGRE